MKITRPLLFYGIAFAAVSYFLWEYLNAPRVFIVSLIITLGVILLLAYNKSRYTKPLGVTLLLIHALRLIGYFIPVYDNTPDIRQRYRRRISTMHAIQGNNEINGTDGNTGALITLANNGRETTAPASAFFNPQPIYQGSRIVTAGAATDQDSRVILSFRDGSTAQIFPQSAVTLSVLAPDFGNLTGSRISIALAEGVITLRTRRTNYTPSQRYVQTNNIAFSCDDCIIATSSARGLIASKSDITRRTEGGVQTLISGGTYSFQNTSLRRSEDSTLASLLSVTAGSDENENFAYDTARQTFIRSQRGRAMDNSVLLAYLSKVKMATVGLFERTYREKYNNLVLYEYLRNGSETVPAPFIADSHLYEFIK